MRDKFIKLTNTVYRILEFFPESDPLKNRAKDKALAIMEHLNLINENSGWVSFQKEKIKVQLLEDIDVLQGYLWIGKAQGWLNSVNCLIIANEYEKIRNEIGPIIEPIIEPMIEPTAEPATEPIIEPTQKLPGILDKPPVLQESAQADRAIEFNIRQEKILDFLDKNEKAQVMDLQVILPDITKRTIRRDLDELLEAGKIVRSGEFNQVFYTIKG